MVKTGTEFPAPRVTPLANQDHLALIRSGVAAWNRWRGHHDTVPDLRGVDLTRANLDRANLSDANLRDAHLDHATLRHAHLQNANLGSADLQHANLRAANLYRAHLDGSYLHHADLTDAILSSTTLANVDLSTTRGLARAHHRGPSTIGYDTLELTSVGLRGTPDANWSELETFLRSAGVSEHMISLYRSNSTNALKFHSCFISYSHKDQAFARKLHRHLTEREIRSWLDEHQLLPGDDIWQQVDRGIRDWDKVLLCCSSDSLNSWWVNNEIQKAIDKEQRLHRQLGKTIIALIPLNLDNYLFDTWQHPHRSLITSRFAADFRNWDQAQRKFNSTLEQLIKALRVDRT